MEYCSADCGSIPAKVQIACFRGDSGVDEYHFVVRPVADGTAEVQLEWLELAYQRALATLDLDMRSALLRRFACRDLSKQAGALAARPFSNPHTAHDPCAVSWVGQPPMPPADVALWAYHVRDPAGALDKHLAKATLTWRHSDLAHHWTTGLTCLGASSAHDQTRSIFEQYDASLRAANMSLADHVVRTWLFVRDIHADYDGIVTARRQFFRTRGLTPDTHFIASTGIEGQGVDSAARLTLDAYAIGGLRPAQVEFLRAPDFLGPTHVYGVTFERGTAVTYRDRRHVIISGTASIDARGEIMYPGDVSAQLDRTLANITALLRKAGATLHDVCVFIAYVRDPGDLVAVRHEMQTRAGPVPTLVVVAPVCRPAWLVEIECVAIVPDAHSGMPQF